MTETIEKVYSLKRYSLILTGKRLICVEVIENIDDRDKKVYKSWNILYRDIMKNNLVIWDIKGKKDITFEELQEQID